MFKFQTEWKRADDAFMRFCDQYDEEHGRKRFDQEHFDKEWEKLQILTPCRRCGTSLDVPNASEYFESGSVLGPMFTQYRSNGERTGQRPRFYYPFDVGFDGFCESCCHDLVPWFQKLADVLEVNKVVNYLGRSIRCQRNNNPVEKSKLLDNLGKCLSTPHSVS